MSTPALANTNPTVIDSEASAPVLNEFGILTLLLRLLVILKNRDGDASIFGFAESEAGGRHADLVIHEPDFALLDSISAITVQQHEIVAACYQEHPLPPDVAVPDLSEGADYLKPYPAATLANFDIGQNCSTDDYAFPVSMYQSRLRFKPKFAITVNPRSGSLELTDEGLHNLRIIKISGDNGHWKEVMSNPLCRMIK